MFCEFDLLCDSLWRLALVFVVRFVKGIEELIILVLFVRCIHLLLIYLILVFFHIFSQLHSQLLQDVLPEPDYLQILGVLLGLRRAFDGFVCFLVVPGIVLEWSVVLVPGEVDHFVVDEANIAWLELLGLEFLVHGSLVGGQFLIVQFVEVLALQLLLVEGDLDFSDFGLAPIVDSWLSSQGLGLVLVLLHQCSFSFSHRFLKQLDVLFELLVLRFKRGQLSL